MNHKSYFFLGGPAHGTIREVPDGWDCFSVHMYKSLTSKEGRTIGCDKTAMEVLVDQIYYHKKLFQEDRRRYIVFALERLEENVVLDLFKQNMYQIPVDRYTLPSYNSHIDEREYHNRMFEQDEKVLYKKQRILTMYELLPTGPSGKPGKAIQTFVMAYCYGAGLKTLQEKTGLGMRRVKVMKRKIDNFGGMMHNEH